MQPNIQILNETEIQLAALETALAALNFEFLTALSNADGKGKNGKFAIEIAAEVLGKLKGIVSEKETAEHRKALIGQWVDSEFAPKDFQDKAAVFKSIATRAGQLTMEAQNAESQSNAARNRAEAARRVAQDQLKASGLTTEQINAIHNAIGKAKLSRV